MRKIFLIGLIFVSFSCSKKDSKKTSQRSDAGVLQDLQKEKIQQIIKDELSEQSDDDNAPKLKGFNIDEGLVNIETIIEGDLPEAIAADALEDLIDSEKPAFDFETPDSLDTSYSPARIASATSGLSFSDPGTELCENETYQENEPVMKDIMKIVREKDVCGDVALQFCIRLGLKTPGPVKNRSFVYTTSPNINLKIPCSADVFSATSIFANPTIGSAKPETVMVSASNSVTEMYLTREANCREGGVWQELQSELPWAFQENTDMESIFVKFRDIFEHESECVRYDLDVNPPSLGSIQVGDSDITNVTQHVLALSAEGASEMYVSNDPSCDAGGQWSFYSSQIDSWSIAQENSENTVYVKYRDSARNESSCYSDSILHDNIAPLEPSLTLGSEGVTNSITQSISLNATGASEMYITNSVNCSGGGMWEPFAKSKDNWSLGQSNTLTGVYAMFRDAAGNQTNCVSDSVQHSGIGPSDPTIAIGSSELTKDTLVDISLSATGASEMYVTNTSGCSAGGVWEAVAANKNNWTLGQVNALANVYAKFRNASGSESACVNDAITHDNLAPSSPTLAIGSSEFTTVNTHSLSLSASGATQMYITNTSGCNAGGTWEAYATSKPSWSIPSNSLSTVYVKYQDEAGNETACINDTITHDDLAPTGGTLSIGSGAVTNSSSPDLNISATGASEMYITNTPGCSTNGTWETFATSRPSWPLAQDNTTATVYIKFRDQSGNESACINDSIIHDSQGPTATSITLAGGAVTNAIAIDIALAATDANEFYLTNLPGCSGGGAWESYATSKSAWPIDQRNSTATVYVKFRDVAENESSCISDSIVHDDQGPTSTSINIGASEIVSSDSQTVNLSAVDVADMYLTNVAGCSSGGTWESYATTKASWTISSNSLSTVYAKFRDANGNESACISDTITHDSVAPTGGSLTIDGGTHVNILTPDLSLAASGANEMYITNTAGCGSNGTWESFATSKSAWSLGQSDGLATVYVKFRDEALNETNCINDTITHDGQGPSGTSITIDGGAVTNLSSPNLSLLATDADDMYITNTAGCSSGGTWESFATSKATWTLGQSNASATVYAKFRDSLGNESICVNDSIMHDSQGPSSPSLTIGSSELVNSNSQTLNLSAVDASEMYLTNTAACVSDGTWEAYATSKDSWTISDNTVSTVYAKFRDAAGNESACINDTITHDNEAPTSGSITIDGGASTNSSSPNLTLSASAADEMYITNTSGCGSGGIWESYATSKNAWPLAQTNATATVYVKFRDQVGNESACSNDTIVHDSSGPSAGSITIDGGVETNSSTPNLTISATNATEMYITNTAACASDGSWESYATSKSSWSLAQSNATATVYIKFRDALLNESTCSDDSIVHDNLAPSAPSLTVGSSELVNSNSQTLNLSAVGASEMYMTNTAGCNADGAWEAYSISKPSWTISDNTVTTVYAKFRDAAGNESSCVSDSITHDSLAPSGGSITISGGASTSSSSPDLSLSASGADEMYITNTAGCAAGGSWESYAVSKSAWSLAQSNAIATVYIKFRDQAGNESACLDDTIIHDSTGPSATSIAISGGTSTNLANPALILAATEASEMYLTNTAGCASDGVWEAFATSKGSWNLAQNNTTATVYVKFRDTLENESACINDTIIHDNIAPSTASLTIGSSELVSSNSQTLNLSASAANEMYITNTAGCSADGVWESYATTKAAWTIGSNTLSTVYVKFRDTATNETACINDTITHDNLAPSSPSIAIAGGVATTASSAPSLSLSASDAYEMYITNTAGCGSGGAWQAYATTEASWTLAQNNATATVYVKYRDEVGNESACINDTIVHDAEGPTFTSISIVGGSHTSSATPDLTLAATDATEMYITNTSGCGAGGVWEAYATSKASWTLAQANTTATVYIKFRDGLATESSCISDTIVHDDQVPSSTSIAIGASELVNLDSQTLNLSASGATEMYLSNTAGCGSGGTWETYAISKAAWAITANAISTVYAKFRDAAGNESACINDTITHDGLAPTGESIMIAGGASTNDTSPDLSLSASDAFEMYITNTAGCASGGIWETYATTETSWPLSQSNEIATVFVKYRDEVGNESSCTSDSIIHDSLPPSSTSIAIAGGAATTISSTPTITLAATGASEMYLTNTAACASDGVWESYSSSKASWTLSQTNASATVYVKFRDAAGNQSTCINDSITHDNTAPTGATLTIQGGANTSSSTPDLNISASGATEMYITNTAACAADGSWESYATSKTSWTLGQANATATVYVKFRDLAGNESTCVNDSIIHDNVAPTATSIAIGSSELVTSDSQTVALVATGATQMYITNTAGCNADGAWEAYATSKGPWTISTNAVTTVYVKFQDSANNESACISDSITHDSIAPTGAALTIAGGSTTNLSSPSLSPNATDAFEMYITNTAGCSADGSWEAYASSKASWPLAQSNALATVYAKYRDEAGNETSCINDTITHDSQAPTSPTLTIDGGASTSSSSPNLTLSAVDATEMYVTNTATCSGDGTWEAYSTSKSTWPLAQANASATVYVKYRDSVGNESTCVNDSITHDNLAPSSTSIAVGDSELVTSTTQTLTLAATGAAEMYITNTATCSADGVWESFASSKVGWSINSNALTTVYVKFRDSSGNESSCINDTITHDNTAPSAASVTISGGASTNSSTPDLVLSASGASEMYITNTAACSADGSWEPYATSKSSWTLGQSNATATVYVKFRDAAGNQSTCVSDTIIHDSSAPTSTSLAIDGGVTTNLSSPNLTLAATDATQMYITNIAACGSGGSWESYATSKSSWSLGQSNGTATVYVKFRDALENESACINDTIIHDDLPPSATSLAVGGAELVSSTSQNLALGASGASEMYITNTSGCNADGSWEAYSSSKAGWTIDSNTLTTVYVKFRDVAGNESGCINDTITHDDTPPSAGSLTIAGGASTNSSAPDLTLSASDATEMYITNTAGCGSDGSWESYATSKASWTLAQNNATATVYVKFRDAVGNQSTCSSDTIVHDSLPPSSTSISIDGGAVTSSSSPNLTLSATDATEMYITNVAACGSGGSWQSYASSQSSWSLGQANSTATVYAKFRDALGNESACINDTMIHDDQPPSAVSFSIGSSELVTSNSQTLNLAATGAGEMYITNTAGCGSGGSWEAYATSKAAWIIGSNVTSTVYAKYRDAALNESACLDDTITHDDQAPSSPSLVIDGGTHTRSTSASLTLSATGGDEMYITNTAGCASGGAWESYATSKGSWTLGQTNATATVYVKYRDSAGNESTCANDSIVHDTTPPASPTGAVATSDFGYNKISWNAVAGATSYLVVRKIASAVGSSPVSGDEYTQDAEYDSGLNRVIYVGTSTSVEHLNLDSSITYHYAIYSYDQSFNYSSAAAINASPNLGFSQYFRYYRLKFESISNFGGQASLYDLNLRFNGGDFSSGTLSSASGVIDGKTVSVTASTTDSTNSAWKSLDSSISSFYRSASSSFATGSPYDALSAQWLKLDFGSGTQAHIDGIILNNNGSANLTSPDSYFLEGSWDNSTWEKISGSVGSVSVNSSQQLDWTYPSSAQALLTFTATSGNTEAILDWTRTIGTEVGVIIVRRAGASTSWTPTLSTSYSLGSLDVNHDLVYAGAGLTFTDTGLTNDTVYHYTAFTFDKNRAYSAASTTSVTPTDPAGPSYDFETGDLTGWTTSGNTNWTVTTSSPSQGTYAGVSGTITHNQNSCIEYDIDLNGEGDTDFSFDWKISSESCCDFGKFYVDGAEKYSGSGTVPWTTKTQVLLGGATRTVKWCYEKDGSVDNGTDNMHLDNALLLNAPVYPATASVGGGNTSVSLSWSDGGGTEIGYIWVRRTGTAVTWTPSNGSSYSTGSLDADHELVYKGSGTSHSDTSLTNGTTYYYAAWGYDGSDDYSSSAATGSATPQACGGTSFDGACWYLGDSGDSCNTTCSNEGLSFDSAAYDRNTGEGSFNTGRNDCRTLLTNLGHSYGADYYGESDTSRFCGLNGEQVRFDFISTNDGSSSMTFTTPVCSCQ